MIFGEELYRVDIKKVDSIKEFLSLKVGNQDGEDEIEAMLL